MGARGARAFVGSCGARVVPGTIEERSIVEPIRKIMSGKGNFFEAVCEQILPDEKVPNTFPKLPRCSSFCVLLLFAPAAH